MKTRWRIDDDQWGADGAKITDPGPLETIRDVLENQGPVIVEHWFYRGSASPERLVFEDFEELMAYLTQKCYAGDAIHVWNFAAVCHDDNELAHGKCPAEDGSVPKQGAY